MFLLTCFPSQQPILPNFNELFSHPHFTVNQIGNIITAYEYFTEGFIIIQHSYQGFPSRSSLLFLFCIAGCMYKVEVSIFCSPASSDAHKEDKVSRNHSKSLPAKRQQSAILRLCKIILHSSNT